ncbi:MAG: sensor histidine kinase, partial [Bacteroidota bacterium]
EVYNLSSEEINRIWIKNKGFKEPVSFDFQDEENQKSFRVSYNLLNNDKFATIYTDVTELKSALFKVEQSSNKLQEQNIAYQKLNTELTEINEDLVNAKEKAEQSDQLKSSFLTNMSHEIRTPMNGIIGYVDILMSEEDETQRHNYLQVIKKSSHQLLNIVNDIVEISKIESGIIETHIGEYKVEDLIKNLTDLFHEEASNKGIELQIINHLDQDAIINTDIQKLRQILENLLSNAIKFTDEGHIDLIIDKDQEYYYFKVKDTGIGIDPEYHEQIFDRFHQAGLSENVLRGGNGLGLAISKAYIESMGGSVWVESEAGKGSMFIVKHPRDL